MGLVITISGLHGTGKSTFARILSKKFKLRLVSAGELFRQIATKRRLTISELSKISYENKEIDEIIDERTRMEAKKGNVVLDGLLAGWMARDEANIKIYLTASESVRVERIARRDGITYDAARKATLLREELERIRFKRFYGIDIDDTSIYDLALNTGLLSVKANVKVIENFIKEYIMEYGRSSHALYSSR